MELRGNIPPLLLAQALVWSVAHTNTSFKHSASPLSVRQKYPAARILPSNVLSTYTSLFDIFPRRSMECASTIPEPHAHTSLMSHHAVELMDFFVLQFVHTSIFSSLCYYIFVPPPCPAWLLHFSYRFAMSSTFYCSRLTVSLYCIFIYIY